MRSLRYSQVHYHNDVVPSYAADDEVSCIHPQTNEQDSDEDLRPHDAIENVGIVSNHLDGSEP